MLRKWSNWIDEIEQDVKDLQFVHDLYREVHHIIRGNPSIDPSHIFNKWINALYINFEAAGVGRLVDERNDTRSLVRLLHEISPNVYLLSRERYLAAIMAQRGMSNAQRNALVNRATWYFDRYLGKQSRGITKEQVQKDIRDLQNGTRKIVRFRHEHLAHLAAGASNELPTVSELQQCMALVGGYVPKYSLLVRRRLGDFSLQLPVDWKAIFRFAWIPPRPDRRKSRSTALTKEIQNEQPNERR
jgi:hypothetical protein